MRRPTRKDICVAANTLDEVMCGGSCDEPRTKALPEVV